MLGVPGGDPLTFSIAVVAAAAASVLVYRDADRHGHYHALSASVAVGIAAVVGFVVASLVGLVVATGYVLLLYLLSYPSTPGIDGAEKRRTPDRPDGTPQGDAGQNIAAADADDAISVIRVEIASPETLREIAAQYDDVPADAPTAKLRSMLRVKALGSVLEEADIDGELGVDDWAEGDQPTAADWHDESPSADPAEGAAAWNAAPSGGESGAATSEANATNVEGSTASEANATNVDESSTSTADATNVDSDPADEEWSTEAIDEDAEEVDAGSIDEWVAVGDGGEDQSDTSTEEAFAWAEAEE